MAATGEAPQRGTGPLGEPLASGSGLRWRRVFPGEGSQLGVLRRWLETLLPPCPARDDVICVATELGTNALVHTASGHGGWFAVEITWHSAVVRVAVADCGAPGGPRMIDDPAGEHGRGLLVVRNLSVRTGVYGDHRGRLVWADVPWGDAGAWEPATPQDPYEAAIRDGQAGLADRFAGVPAAADARTARVRRDLRPRERRWKRGRRDNQCSGGRRTTSGGPFRWRPGAYHVFLP